MSPRFFLEPNYNPCFLFFSLIYSYKKNYDMAPTLNSTLIHPEESNDRESSSSSSSSSTTTSPVEETEKELSQFSPILARPARRRAPSSPHPGHSKTATLFTSSLDYASSRRNLNEVRLKKRVATLKGQNVTIKLFTQTEGGRE